MSPTEARRRLSQVNEDVPVNLTRMWQSEIRRQTAPSQSPVSTSGIYDPGNVDYRASDVGNIKNSVIQNVVNNNYKNYFQSRLKAKYVTKGRIPAMTPRENMRWETAPSRRQCRPQVSLSTTMAQGPYPAVMSRKLTIQNIPVSHVVHMFLLSFIGSTSILLGTTTCWIAAEHALQHARNIISSVSEVFGKWQIQKSEYVILAGFDESLIKSGVGYLEQIHVFIIAEVDATSPLLSELGRLFSPFSSILFRVLFLSSSGIQRQWKCVGI